MANKIIPQPSPECKGISEIIKDLETKTNRIGYLMGASALKRGNYRAETVIRSYGGDIFLDDTTIKFDAFDYDRYPVPEMSFTGFTTPLALASFLGVNCQYMRNAMALWGFSSKKTPDDVRKLNVIRYFGYGTKTSYHVVCDVKPDAHSLTNTLRKQKIQVPNPSSHCTFISARVALCLCFIMVYGQRIPKDSVALKILSDLEKDSLYAKDARAILINLGLLPGEKQEPEQAQPIPSPTTGISIDELISILKVFSGEIAAAVGREVAQALNGSQKPINIKKCGRQKREINAASIVEMYNNGMSINKIAETVGLYWKGVYERLVGSGIDVQLRNGSEKHVEPDNWIELVSAHNRGELSYQRIANMLGWGKETVRKHIMATNKSANYNALMSERRSA